MNQVFNTGQFTTAFVSRLIELGESAIYPKSPRDRRGFWAVVGKLEEHIEALRKATNPGDRSLYRSLVVIRNELQASSTGAFDALETSLRNLQLNFTNCPNPDYEEIAFTISRPFAEEVLQELPPSARAVVASVAEEFRAARRA